ncbi:hybrid non-ribosomal peptide synthetase/type I polyketide synthase [Luteimonas sp. A611]
MVDASGYWESTLAGAPESIGLSTDGARSGFGSVAGRLSPVLAGRIDALAAAQSVERSDVLLAAFLLLLHRLSSQADIVLPRAGLDGQALPLRFELADDIDVAACLRTVATRSREAAQNAQAWRESGVPAPDWQVLFSDGAPIAATDGLLLAMRAQPAEADGGILVELHFANALLDSPGAERWLGYWRQLLDAMLDQPQARIADLAMLTPAQLAEAVEAGNDTGVAFEPVANVHRLFELQAARTPDALALVQGGRRLSYAELDAQANRLARHLRACGVGPDERVAIYVERGVEVVLGLLAVLKAGGAYVPLDPTYPADRLAYTLADSEPRVLLTMSGMENPAHEVLGELPPSLAVIDLRDDAAWRALPAHALESGEGDVGAANLAYVLYTSGSTGKPKGVAMTHGPLVNLIQWQMREPGNDAPLRTLQFAALGFDVAFQETFATLATGGELHLIDQDTRLSAGKLFEFIVERRIERLFLPYFALQMLAEGLEGQLAALAPGERVRCDLRQVITAGEQLRIEPKIVRFFSHLPGVRLHNHYGPTETHVVTALTLDEDPTTWPRLPSIGRPIANARVYVLDGHGRPLPTGVVGEIHLAGPVVARGYLKRPDLSDERFLADPFADRAARMYRTGDLGRRLPDGSIEYLGRQDFQVKIRGFRVELGEIEAQVMAFPGVRQAGVLAREDVPGLKRLVAYLAPQDAAAPVDLEPLRQHLIAHLPDYMVPVAYVQMDALPLSPNGKLDRGKLPAPGRGRPDWAGQYAAPRTPVESALCRIFADVLDLEDLGRDDNFFDLGGTSLLAFRVLESARRERVGDVPPMALFRSPTPALLAAEMAAGASTTLDASRLSTRRGNDDEPIAIIAMAGRFPGAASVEALWDNLCAGRDSVARFSAEQLDPGIPESMRSNPGYVPARGVFDDVDRFDAAFFGISPKEAELMDPQQRVFLELCWECIERAGHVPDATTVPVGVFAGMYNASYYQRHVLSRPDLVEKLGAFQVMLGNEKDYIATRVAHKLNLTGPAISVHTACSTSLVAIAQAIDSLRAGRCGMALAGGIAVTCPVNSGHLYQEGGMLSADGSTRSFDADATGTVFSDGAAVVLLKRLSDAIADGNPVYAVVRGAAINNDGGGKASFTAPSSEGQAAVIAMAHADAGVDARSIGYVETHGTATPMGDPIEIEGLTRAFRQGTTDTGFCVVGSVKSNIGHTLMAAGATGVIKTAYALQHGCIPPTAHFRSANPVIDFDSTPFHASGELLPWPEVDGVPRRAGVSSFGVGGTNAHVVMEQPPLLPATQRVDGPQLLVLSARTPVALSEAVARLADHLESEPGINLADVAWTLAVGRKAFAHRVAIAAEDSADAVARLRSAELGAAAAKTRPVPAGEAVFLFPGQGCQYAGMGRELHAREPAFREAFDACAAVLDGELGLDLRALVFGDDGDALLPTAIMQPAIFSIEYSLARWWMAQGVVPVAMAGHSVGEFVAATLAGVFELPDALRLVARRGRLMQAQPSGAMLSVRMPHDALAAKLPDTLSLAAENAPGTCVVAGPHGEVAALQSQLEAEGVACRLLKTSHAFHSAMMDEVVPRFRSEVEALVRRAPTIPIVSTATGDWLSDDQATSAEYWAQHLRQPVRFSAAISRLLERREHVLLEIGPRNTLATLARQQPLLQKQRIAALASLADAPEREHAALVTAFGQAWAAGLSLRPEALDRRDRKARLRLPTYPFERKRYWVEVAVEQPQVVATETHAHPATTAAVVLDSVATAATESTALGPSGAASAAVDMASILDLQLQLMSQQLAVLSAAGDDQDAVLKVLQKQRLMPQQLSVAALAEPAGP